MKVLPVTDRAAEYADSVAKALDAQGFRVEVDHRSEKIGKKIREAQLEKVPYMLVVGDRDMENQTVSLRLRSGECGGQRYQKQKPLFHVRKKLLPLRR